MKNQQYRVYAGEARVRKGARFSGARHIKEFVDKVMAESWWPDVHPDVLSVEVKDRPHGDSVGCYYEDTQCGLIEMAPNHWYERTVLHELSHVCANAIGSTAHDPIFCRVYLELVYRVMGTEVWMELRQALLDEGCVIDPRDDQ